MTKNVPFQSLLCLEALGIKKQHASRYPGKVAHMKPECHILQKGGVPSRHASFQARVGMFLEARLSTHDAYNLYCSRN